MEILQLSGFHHWLLHSYAPPSRSPGPGLWQYRPTQSFVGAAPTTLTRTSGIKLPCFIRLVQQPSE